MRTILVLGASGFIGSNLVNYLRKKHKVIATFNRNFIRFHGVTHYPFNLGDKDYLKRLMTLSRPDVIVYCAGINDLAECQRSPRMADAVNSHGVIAMAAAAEATPARFIYLSSAYTYDGRKGSYVEGDVCLPDTAFGKMKLAGENYVRSKFLDYTILRLSPVYGIGSIYHPSIFDAIRMKLERGQRVDLPDNEVHSFLNINIVLKAIEWAAAEESTSKSYNLSGLTKLTWYDFGVAIANSLGLDATLIVPVRGQFEEVVDFSLNGSDLIRKLQIDPLILDDGLDLLKQQLVASY